MFYLPRIFESIICLDKTIADKTQDIVDAHFLWNCSALRVFERIFSVVQERVHLQLHLSVCHCVCLCEYGWQCAFATGDTHTHTHTHIHAHTVNVFQLCFQAFQRDESGFSRRIVCGGESQLNWAMGMRGQRPDGLGLQCSLLSPCLINKVNTGRAVWLLGLQLLPIGSKCSKSAVQFFAPLLCLCRTRWTYDGGVGIRVLKVVMW